MVLIWIWKKTLLLIIHYIKNSISRFDGEANTSRTLFSYEFHFICDDGSFELLPPFHDVSKASFSTNNKQIFCHPNRFIQPQLIAHVICIRWRIWDGASKVTASGGTDLERQIKKLWKKAKQFFAKIFFDRLTTTLSLHSIHYLT